MKSRTFQQSSATFLLQPPTKSYTPLLCFLPPQWPAITERRGVAPGHSWEPENIVEFPLCSKVTSRVSADSKGSPCWPVASVPLLHLSTPFPLLVEELRIHPNDSLRKKKERSRNHRAQHALQEERTAPSIMRWSGWHPHPCLRQHRR